jgi:thymidine kinase
MSDIVKETKDTKTTKNEQKTKNADASIRTKNDDYCRLDTGPMMSDKTSTLKKELLRHIFRKEKVVIVRSNFDKRWEPSSAGAEGGGGLKMNALERELSGRVTHDGGNYIPAQYTEEAKQYIVIVRCTHLDELKTREDLLQIKPWFIDELHFFESNPPTWKSTTTQSSGAEFIRWLQQTHQILVCSLNLDCERKPFTITREVETFADQHHTHLAICMKCGAPARFTRCLDVTPNAPRLRIGGKELYEPRCRHCFEL